MIAFPIPHVDFDAPNVISHLILLGDRAFDERLLEVLQGLPEAALVNNAQTGMYGGLVDPIFGPTMSLAHRSKQRIDGDIVDCIAWNCDKEWFANWRNEL